MDAKCTGEKIAALRKEKGMTQKELAIKVYVTDKAVSKWERGLNFPDLSLLEALAEALGTTTAYLLGIEDAGKEEMWKTLAEVSKKQKETTAGIIRRIGWFLVTMAVIFALASSFLEGRVHVGSYFNEIKSVTRIIKFVVAVMTISGIVLLKKYGAIKEWDIADWLLMYLIIGAGLTYGGMHLYNLVTYEEKLAPVCFLIAYLAVISGCQVLFYRVIKSWVVKLLPVSCAVLAGFLCGLDYAVLMPEGTNIAGRVLLYYVLPGVLCLVLLLLCLWKNREKLWKKVNIKQVLVCATLLMILLFVFGQDFLTRTYVKLFHTPLEHYAEQLLADALDEVVSDRYGFWEVVCYKDRNLVEFQTGGSGLVTNSRYWGFYYSPDDVHLGFQGYPCILEPDEYREEAMLWEEKGTDNGGTSIRMFPKWYWYEAHF